MYTGFPWYKVVANGTEFPPTSLVVGHTTKSLAEVSNGRWTFLSVASVQPDFKEEEYVSLLASHFSHHLVSVYALPQKSLPKSDPDISDVIFAQTQTGIADRLRLPANLPYNWFFVLDPHGIVRFSIPKGVSLDALRQLAEKYVGGGVDYQPLVQPAGIALGAPLPAIHVESLAGGPQMSLNSLCRGACVVLFLQAQCTQCAATNILQMVAPLLHRRKGPGATSKIVPLFSSAFHGSGLEVFASADGISNATYIATGPVPGWEDPYSTFGGHTIAFSIKGDQVSEVSTIDDFLAKSDPQRANGNTTTELVSLQEAAVAEDEGASISHDAASEFKSINLTSPSRGLAPVVGLRTELLWGLATDGSHLYLLDRTGNRVLELAEDGTVLREFGGIGQGPGEMYSPAAISVSSDKLAVLDLGNSRVEIFTSATGVWSSFRIGSNAHTIGLTQNSDAILNMPNLGYVVTRLHPTGSQAQEFGSFPDLSKIFPDHPGKWPGPGLARARLVVSSDGSIYAVYNFLPLVQKFDQKGRFQWQVILRGPAVSRVEATFWGEPDSQPPILVENLDGRQLSAITSAACLGPNDSIIVAMADRSLFEISSNGKEVVSRKSVRLSGGPIMGLAALGGDLFATTPLHLYRATLSRVFGSSSQKG